METEIADIRKGIITRILAKQDGYFRWAFDEQTARERPELTHYWPKYKSTLWTLLLLAEVRAPIHTRQIDRSLRIVMNHFYDTTHKIFSLGTSHFPVPCLNGNMLYLHFYFKNPYSKKIDGVVEFFNSYQRFDDGDFKTPKTFPYFANASCYGKHTCYGGIIRLLKGLSFIPASLRTRNARRLINNCVDFILQHEVCFRSHRKDEFMQPGMDTLTFPGFWKDDSLEILWLLSREGIRDGKLSRAIKILRSKRKSGGFWELEHPAPNLIVSLGRKGCPNAFITERACAVLDFYGY
jgi:hypothetical protein